MERLQKVIAHAGITSRRKAEEFILAKKLGAIINLDDITHIDFLKLENRTLWKWMKCQFIKKNTVIIYCTNLKESFLL